MADQTPIEADTARAGPHTLHHDLAHVAHDMIALAELQLGLLRADSARAGRQMVVPAALTAAALLLGIASFPVLLASLALALSAWMPLAAAFLLAGLTGLVTGAALLGLAWRRAAKCLDAFHRTREEFSENVRWIKAVLQRSG